MRIVLEGLPGAGKTTLANRLCAEHPWPLVPEWAGFTEAQWTQFRFHQPFYFANDEMKEQMARTLVEPVVVMDRHYASTLAFGYGLEVDGLPNPKPDESYAGNLSWYRTAMTDGRLSPPDVVIVLDIPSAVSLARQPRARAFDAVWGEPSRLEAMRRFYEEVYPTLEPNVAIHRIDATNPIDQVYRALKERSLPHTERRQGHG